MAMETQNSAKSAETRLDELRRKRAALFVASRPGDEDVQRLKALGICVGRRIEVFKSGDPLIIRVFGSRIGLSVALAAHVWIERCALGAAAEINHVKTGLIFRNAPQAGKFQNC